MCTVIYSSVAYRTIKNKLAIFVMHELKRNNSFEVVLIRIEQAGISLK